jgi:transcriptional regulator with XRE-family HTH domain
MSIIDETTTGAKVYAGWDIDVVNTSPEGNRKTIWFDFGHCLLLEDGDEVSDDGEDFFVESLVLSRPTVWGKILQFAEGFAKPNPTAELLDEASMLRRARHYLSLNIKELAEIMGVERPTIYSWLDGTIKIRKSNKERIQTIYALAETWWSKANAPLDRRLYARPAAGMRSIFEMLKETDLQAGEILAMLELLSTTPPIPAAPVTHDDDGEFAKASSAARKASIRRASRRTRR